MPESQRTGLAGAEQRREGPVPLPVDLVVAGHVPDYCAAHRAGLARRPELITRSPIDQLTCRIWGHRQLMPALLYDTGALVAAERRHPLIWGLHDRANVADPDDLAHVAASLGFALALHPL